MLPKDRVLYMNKQWVSKFGIAVQDLCCNVAIGWEGYLANGGPQGPIYGQNRQRTASNRLLESHRKQSSNGLQQLVDLFVRNQES